MAKAGRKSNSNSNSKGAPASETKQVIVVAAMATLKELGFAGASARAIARRGGFNPALVFYHFGSVNDLLLAALDQTSDVRQEHYRRAVQEAETLPELVAAAQKVFVEDLEAGHIKVLSEMIAGTSTVPELGPAVRQRIEPWIALTDEALGRVLPADGIESVVPRRTLAFAIVALYLGLEMLTELDGNRLPATELFAAASQLSGLLGLLIPSTTKGSSR